jgi:hypothetical protein
MGFLDELPYRFDDPRGRRLLADLLQIFNAHEPTVRQFVEAAGVSLHAIGWTSIMGDVWPDVLRVAAQQRKLRTLVEVVARSDDGAGIDFLHILLAEPLAAGALPANGTDPYNIRLLGSGLLPQPFIARHQLRRLLRDFAEQGARVLVVSGERRAGKSYSWFLINHIAEVVRGVRPSLLDLTKWSGPPMGPQEVMEMIAEAVGLPRPDRDPLAQDHAESMRLGLWFLRMQRARRDLTWLVIDGLDQSPLTDAARRLIADVVKGVRQAEAGDLRIVLLEGPKPDPGEYGILHDPIQPEPIDELRCFFNEASAIGGAGELTDEAFTVMLTELFGDEPVPDSLCLEKVGPRAARLAGELFLAGR